jgi:hypothetical protein
MAFAAFVAFETASVTSPRPAIRNVKEQRPPSLARLPCGRKKGGIGA